MTNKVYVLFIYAVVLILTMILTMSEAIAGEEKYGPMIREVAIEYGIDPNLALAIAEVESKFDSKAVGSLGEIGLFQLRPEFHNVVKGDTRNNARVAMAYLNDVRRVCGPKYGDRFWLCFNTGPYRKQIETPEKLPYVKKVTESLNRRKALQYVGR